MPCQEINSWTFEELVGAFLHLAITYFLLCVSTLAFFTKKFLRFFGLCLPCPCNGLFGDRNRNKCWQRLLIHMPSENASNVLFSVKSMSPFYSTIRHKDLKFEFNIGMINEKNCGSDRIGLEGEASSSSFRERRRGVMHKGCVKDRRFDSKGKGVSCQLEGYLRQRRKMAADNGRVSSVSLSDYSRSDDARARLQSPASVNKMMDKCNQGDMVPAISGANSLHFEDSKDKESSVDVGFVGTDSNDFKAKEPVDAKEPAEKNALPVQDLKCNAEEGICFDRDEKKTIRVLEQSLEEEQGAHASVYLELEKERSAAAIAADEAMAMILRLQEEKALLAMEAKQYQRMIEEKSAYELEEMNILKEIVLRREREKHFLEKELETYRQIIFGNEKSDSDVEGMLTMHEQQGRTPSPEKELLVPEFNEVDSSMQGFIHQNSSIEKLQRNSSRDTDHGINDEYEEKELASIDKSPIHPVIEARSLVSHSQFNLSTRGNNFHEKTISTIAKSQQRSDRIDTNQELTSKATETRDLEHGSEKLSENAASDLPRTGEGPYMSSPENEIGKRCSEITNGSPPLGSSRSKSLLSNFRRNSMSAFDYERLKIDSEIGWLQDRLRIIQEGRDKLNIPVKNREKEKTQLQVLENIVSQLKEIRQSTEHEKAVRRASLPPLPGKVKSKKRRWRSNSCASLGADRSS